MKSAAGFLLATAVIVLAGLGIYSGLYNVAANEPHSDLTKWILSTAMRRSVIQHSDRAGDSVQLTDEQAAKGFHLYNETCVYCHGAPGKDPSDIGKGLNPEPPYLADTVGRWSNAELFWIIKNGVKMTGMPSFGATHKDPEIWALVAFVRRLPKVTEEQYNQMEK